MQVPIGICHSDEKKLEAACHKFERKLLGSHVLAKLRNKDIRKKTGLQKLRKEDWDGWDMYKNGGLQNCLSGWAVGAKQ